MAAPVLTSTDSASSSTLLGIGNGGDFSRFVSIANTDANALCVRIGAAFNYKLVG